MLYRCICARAVREGKWVYDSSPPGTASTSQVVRKQLKYQATAVRAHEQADKLQHLCTIQRRAGYSSTSSFSLAQLKYIKCMPGGGGRAVM